MNHTPQIKKAIQFAARKHHGQLRKETEPLPYVTHLFSVALLVAEDGAHDDVVTAALLHDTLEDTDTTHEEIVMAFNEHVAELVESVSEIKEKDGEGLSWKETKVLYLGNLEITSDEAILISTADKVDNIESAIEEVEKVGNSFFTQWEHPYEEHIWFHNEVLRIVQKRLPKHRLAKRLADAQLRLLELYKNG